MAKLLRLGDSSQCGHVTNWATRQAYNIYETRGCQSLGIQITDDDFALIKLQKMTNGQQYISISESKHSVDDFFDKITYFSPKLKLCSHQPDKWISNDLDTELSSPACTLMTNTSVILTSLALFYTMLFL